MAQMQLPTRAQVLAALVADGASMPTAACSPGLSHEGKAGAVRALLQGGGLKWMLASRAELARSARQQELKRLPLAWATLADSRAAQVQELCELLGMRAVDCLRPQLLPDGAARAPDAVTPVLARWHQETSHYHRERRLGSLGRLVLLAAIAGLDQRTRDALLRCALTDLQAMWRERGGMLIGEPWMGDVSTLCQTWVVQAQEARAAANGSREVR